MNDLNILQQMRLPVDDLIDKYYRPRLNLIPCCDDLRFCEFRSRISLELVKKVSTLAQEYIVQLLRDKERYGFLYFLETQNLIVDLDLQYNPELIVEQKNALEIKLEISKIAEHICCKGIRLHTITCIELLYFYVLLVNPNMTWIEVDYLLRGNKKHDYVIAHPDRLI